MPQAAPAKKELFRLATLYDYNILDSGANEVIDKLLGCAKLVMQMPFAAVSLVDAERQWFKSHSGVDFCETPRRTSFCAHGLERNEPLIVTDAARDSRFCDNPLVITGVIAAYFGVPLVAPNGMQLGMLCVGGPTIRAQPSDEQIACLTDLADLIMHEFESHRLGHVWRKSVEDAEHRAERLERINLRQEEVLNARAAFFATLSHELRTPLHGILGFNSLIQERSATVIDVEAFAAEVQVAGERMRESIDITLELSMGWKPRGRMQPAPVDVVPLLKDVARFTEGFAFKRGVKMALVSDDAPGMVAADKNSLKHALLQICINAITACPRGGLVTAAFSTTALGAIAIEIFNSGEPISRVAAAQALTPLGQPCIAGGDGTGIRLPISRMAIEQVGGTITLRGEAERGGTAATVTLPAAESVACLPSSADAMA